MLTLLLVMAGGAVGAGCRFLVDHEVTRRLPGPLPWGTFVVNVTGSLLLGLVAGAGAALPGWVGGLVGVGFCGALTTYSTFGFETLRLATTAGPKPSAGNVAAVAPGRTTTGPGGPLLALLNVAGTLTVGISAAAVGWLVASRLG